MHPGYGFLSESAEFARAVLDAGLTWVGPAPESIEAMGSKIRAKELMRKAGVPVLRGAGRAHRVRPPAAGEGVRGWRWPRDARRPRPRRRCRPRWPRRRPRRRRRSATARSSSSRTSSAGATSRCRWSATGHGVLVLGERDCSLQRRHQKVVEETPAPHLPERTRRGPARRGPQRPRARSTTAAPARSSSSTTRSSERFFFLEMNTRLQVEHPVTELVHGVDLVELQLAVAEGRALDPRAIGETYGHAIEVRLYAEDPAADWQPQSGTLTAFDVPGVERRVRPAQPARAPARLRVRARQRGLDPLRRDAGQGGRLGARPRAGRPAAGRRAGQGSDPRRHHQPRPAGGDPAGRGVPRG